MLYRNKKNLSSNVIKLEVFKYKMSINVRGTFTTVKFQHPLLGKLKITFDLDTDGRSGST